MRVPHLSRRVTGGAFDFGSFDGPNTFVYDGESRATSANSGNATYTYDGNGVRVQKAISGCRVRQSLNFLIL